MEKRNYSYMLFLIVLIALKVSAIQLYLHDCSDVRNVNDCEQYGDMNPENPGLQIGISQIE